MVEEILYYLHETTFFSSFVRLFMAAVFGGLIGMERGRRRRAAGLRTHMLVCMGAALVMLTNQYIAVGTGSGDASRMGAQVISGIGFLGAGTIMVDRHQQVRGLTTAAGLWACACMGLALGVGYYSGAIIACAFILAIIVILNRIEQSLFNRSRIMEIYVEFEDEDSQDEINRFVQTLVNNSIKVKHIEMVKPRSYNPDKARVAAVFKLHLPKRQHHSDILEDINSIGSVLAIEELNT